MKPITRLVMATFAATLIPVTVMAESQDSKNQGYLVDTLSGSIVTSGTGLCWRDSDWTPARGKELCDPTNKPVAAVASTPTPAVLTIVEPALPVAKASPQKIHFSGDALFAFDKSQLKPAGKKMLDELVHQLDGAATYETILATGYTDRFGSNKYNQKLSERRAHAVKDYLVSKNVRANRVDAEGKGETQPMTKVGDCQGTRSAKVIACLQPDRRVDIEMKGTKIIASAPIGDGAE